MGRSKLLEEGGALGHGGSQESLEEPEHNPQEDGDSGSAIRSETRAVTAEVVPGGD